jgi:hypothetical protein
MTLGIGQQIAIAFARRGCTKLFLVDLSQDGLNQTKILVASENADAQVICHIANVTEESSVKGMVDACVAKFGRIDFACNNAGLAMPNNKTTDVDTKAFDRMFGVNSKGVGGFSAMRAQKWSSELTPSVGISLPQIRDYRNAATGSAYFNGPRCAKRVPRIDCEYSFNSRPGCLGWPLCLPRIETQCRFHDSGGCQTIRRQWNSSKLRLSWLCRYTYVSRVRFVRRVH